MNDRRQLDQQIFAQRVHLGPVGDVRTHDQLDAGVGLAEAIIDAVVVGRAVKVIRMGFWRIIHIGRGRDAASVAGRRSDGARVHQADAGELPLARLGAFAVREIARGVAEGQAVVGRHIACTEARAAEAGLDDRAGLHQLCRRADAHQLHGNGHGGGIDGEAERTGAGRAAAEDIRRLGDVVEQAAAASGNDALIGPDAAVMQLVGELYMGLGEALLRVGLDLRQKLRRMLLELVNGPGVGRMERKRDHALDLVEVNGDHAVIIGVLSGVQLAEVLCAAMRAVEALRDFVGLPDGGQAGRLGGHDVHAVAEVDGKAGDAGACELQHAVLDEAALKGRLDQSDSHVVRADALSRLAGKVDQNDLRHGNVPCILEKLLGKLRAALADGHGAERAVARVGVGAEDHAAAAGQLLAGIGMDDALVRRNVDAAVLLRGGEAEHVIVLIDRAADGTEAVVAVGERIGNGEFLHAGGTGLLDDADIGNIM